MATIHHHHAPILAPGLAPRSGAAPRPLARAAGARVRGDGHVPWTVGRGWSLLLSRPSTTTITKQDMDRYGCL